MQMFRANFGRLLLTTGCGLLLLSSTACVSRRQAMDDDYPPMVFHDDCGSSLVITTPQTQPTIVQVQGIQTPPPVAQAPVIIPPPVAQAPVTIPPSAALPPPALMPPPIPASPSSGGGLSGSQPPVLEGQGATTGVPPGYPPGTIPTPTSPQNVYPTYQMTLPQKAPTAPVVGKSGDDLANGRDKFWLGGGTTAPGSETSAPTGPGGRLANALFGGGKPGTPRKKFAWQELPHMLGDASGPLEFVNNDNTRNTLDNNLSLRNGNAAQGNGVSSSQSSISFGLTNSTGNAEVGGYLGLLSGGGDSAALSPTVYGKRALVMEDDRLVGIGLGVGLPTGETGIDGSLFPWIFTTRRIGGGDSWFTGSATLIIPFGESQDFACRVDAGLMIPVYRGGPESFQVYFQPELHANFALSNGSGNFGSSLESLGAASNRFGNPDFAVNTTLGFGIRRGSYDLQIGVAIPLLNDRFYNYETIFRAGYRF